MEGGNGEIGEMEKGLEGGTEGGDGIWEKEKKIM